MHHIAIFNLYRCYLELRTDKVKDIEKACTFTAETASSCNRVIHGNYRR